MRVELKGINKKTVKLASGTVATYYYAWKGGPRLSGKPGSPEFTASYLDAVSRKTRAADNSILWLLDRYQQSSDFIDKAKRTRADYLKQIHKIESEFGDFPLTALADRRTRGEFLAWRDRLAIKSRRQADYAFQVLALVMAWGKERGHIAVNPCERGGRLYQSKRADQVWSDADEAAFLAAAPGHLHLPLLLALWTGQRQGDLLRLPWSAYDGARIRLKQGKTGVRIVIPVGAPLKAALDATPRRSPLILTNMDGVPWTSDGFRSSWRKACIKAGIVDLTFHDLRGTAVTRLAVAGASVPEIAAITGHSLRDVSAILDSHYLSRDPALGEAAIRKLETRTKAPE
ncbi:tyrosine-type recombinase/integrase [Ancylobacter vacuolatus]|uniref:Integrase n=1 Tax=Ancylobacter vacuolatus TaxID=223389 RepID=A0ABU0DHJ4_9HYPH|nr:site-specific integrase [Ancylobacter vacuolatus]MDQ0347877.1 integrase [Ancylobacter vacuolatus]